MAAPTAETAVESLLSMCQDKLTEQELAFVEDERAVLVAKKLGSPDIIALLTVEQLERAGMSLGAAAALKKAFPSAAGAAGAAVFSAKGYELVGAQHEGLKSQPAQLTIPRYGTCNIIISRCSSFGFQLLKGPPRSGKTSLLQLLDKMVNAGEVEGYSKAIYITLLDLGELSWRTFFEQETKESWDKYIRRSDGGAAGAGSDGLVLLCIDEMQSAYGKATQQLQDLLDHIKSLATASPRSTRIVMASIHGDSPSFGERFSASSCTPFQYGPEHLVSLYPSSPGSSSHVEAAAAVAAAADDLAKAISAADEAAKAKSRQALAASAPGLALTTEEFEALWAAPWCDPQVRGHLFTMTAPAVKEHLFWVTGGQVGMVVLILTDLFNKVKANKHASPQALVGAGDKIYLALFRTGTIYEVIAGQRSFMREAFQEGKSSTAELLDKLLCADLVDGVAKAQLCGDLKTRAEALATVGRLCDEQGRIRFWSPIHALYYSNLQYTARRSNMADGPDSLVNFLKLCVCRMSADQLSKTLSRRAGGQRLLERAYQMEFYRACCTLLPKDCCISADVSMGGAGWVDFWVSGKSWAVELLCDGMKLAEHEARFATGGKYDVGGVEAYAVVDFRGPGAARPNKRPKCPSTYIVTFDEGYRVATCIAADTQVEMFKVQTAQDEAHMHMCKLK